MGTVNIGIVESICGFIYLRGTAFYTGGAGFLSTSSVLRILARKETFSTTQIAREPAWNYYPA